MLKRSVRLRTGYPMGYQIYRLTRKVPYYM
jgi:hypothetical protein